ncbi:MAG: iron chelate uptake ABC transporter family permease subunit, partial [Thermoanaerobaculia bacterium]|nr:iron chelate uptake ABC transporter family permease subunit [Thermoanaerobaculia bacterium]
SMPAALLLGAAFVAIADTLARSTAAIELPLGILTAFVGAPAFLWLLARGGRFS